MKNDFDGGASLIAFTQDQTVDFLQTLFNCQGYYECSVDEQGNPQGPIMGYAGKYVADGKEEHYVGLKYYNYSEADQWPAVNRVFAKQLAKAVTFHMDPPDVLLGAPMAGIPLSVALAEELGCRRIYAEKKVIAVGKDGQRDEEELVLSRYDIHPGDRVLIGEELVNNISSAQKLIALIENAGGEYVGISCAINRSSEGLRTYQGRPIASVLYVPTPQYRQDEPMIQEALARGLEIIWKPKPRWAELKTAMSKAVSGEGGEVCTLAPIVDGQDPESEKDPRDDYLLPG